MALATGSLTDNLWLDNFMVSEGYEHKKRLYSRVINCWCGSKDLTRAAGSSAEFEQYQLCRNCGCLILKYILTALDLSELYGMRYFREHQQAIGLPSFQARYENDINDRIPVWLGILKRFCPQGRVLEIGSSHGRFVKELSALEYEVVGLELDQEICEWSRKKTGCDIRCTTIDRLNDSDFDVIFANDVLEHLYNPKEFIQNSMRLLRVGGQALFQTVVFDEWRQCPVRMLRPLFHTVLYSRASLKLLQDDITASLISVEKSVFDCSVVVFQKMEFIPMPIAELK